MLRVSKKSIANTITDDATTVLVVASPMPSAVGWVS
jgi:hypothetical protein